MGTDLNALQNRIAEETGLHTKLSQAMSKVIIGQRHLLNSLLAVLYSGGHILLEGLPGLAKTLTIRTLAQCLDASFSRIQFTPDLLPADVLGTLIYNQGKAEFVIRKGPLFSNLVLADEINRAPAKVQSALLEAMQEKQITIGEQSFKLEEPFMVLATQNPIEQEGTYTLPEAQLDRFLMKVVLTYPTIEEELIIMRLGRQAESGPVSRTVIRPADVLRIRSLVQSIHLDEKLENYILSLVFATRFPDQYGAGNLKGLISFGASPRASLGLARAAQAMAFMDGRYYVEPEDVRVVLHDVLRHRIGISYEGIAENFTADIVIDEIVKVVPVP